MNATTKLNVDQLKEMSISDIMDLDWSLIEEAQGIVLPPEGAYILGVKDAKIEFIGKEGSKKEAIQVSLVVNSTVELANPSTDVPVAEGSEFNVSYFGGNSVPYMKRDFTACEEVLKPAGLKDYLNKLKGTTVVCIISHRANSTNPTQKYPQLNDITLA